MNALMMKVFPSWQPTRDAPGVPRFGKELTTSQQANLNDLIKEIKDVFSTKPGKTTSYPDW